MDCARRGAVDQGSAAGSGHGSKAQDTAAMGLKAEAAPTVRGSGLGCSRDQFCGGSTGSGH